MSPRRPSILLALILGASWTPVRAIETVPDWENPAVFGRHTLPAHATLTPWPDEGGALGFAPERSPWRRLLNGAWRFHYRTAEVQQRARAGKADCASCDTGGQQGLHLLDILCRGRFPVDPALAHHVNPQGPVGHQGGNIDIAGFCVQRIQEFGEALPGPGQSFRHHGTRYLLHALHQLHQYLVVLLAAGRKPDAAIAHHHGSGPQVRGGVEVRIPDRLAVVVGVHIDETRGDDFSRGVNFPAGTGGEMCVYRRNQAVPDGDVATE